MVGDRDFGTFLVCSLALTLFALRLFRALQQQSWQIQLFERCC